MRKPNLSGRGILKLATGMVMAFFLTSNGQDVYPPTITVPVTYFDYHSDGSNPDFNSGTNPATVLLGMVQPRLDAQGLPVATTTYLYSWGIGKWFRPWPQGTAGGGNDFSRPAYANGGHTLVGVNTVGYDTSYKNVVVPDSLVFNLVQGSQGIYQYQNANFFPLDTKGFQANGAAPDPTKSFDGTQLNRVTNTHNYSFAMHLHRNFEYASGQTFYFEGDDDLWVFVDSQLVLDIGGVHNTTVGQFNLDDFAAQLHLTPGDSAALDVFYCERQAVGSDIRITTNIITAVPAKLVLTMVPKKDTLASGDSATFTGSVIDSKGKPLPNLSQYIQWNLTPAATTSSISQTSGGTSTFYAVQAYDTYIVGASYAVSPTNILYAYDTIFVKPGPDYKVWIEPDTNINPNDRSTASLTRLQNPDHDPLISISDVQSQANAFGIVRDKAGNFTRFANNAEWNEYGANLGIAKITASTPKYVGLIQRIPGVFGTTKAQAQETGLLWDTTTVSILNGYIKQLRFVDVATGQPITGININTDQEITVKLQGILSTDSTNAWIDVTGTWTLSPNIASANPIPTGDAGSWSFSPTAPGGPSQLTGTTGSGAHVVNVQIPVTVTVAPPSSATFTLITPPAQRIAGDTLLALVTISNHDGLVPGSYCYPATTGTPASYQDSLGKGAIPNDPTVTTGAGSGIINTPPGGTNTVPECFKNGVDTVKIVLYRAPYTDPDIGGVDTLHQLTVNLNGVTATTGPFKLLPAGLYRLQLESATGVHLTGTYSMSYPNGQLTAYSIGYDIYGNKRGKENSDWSVTQTLHPLTQASNVPRIYYDASTATNGEAGFLIARAQRTYGGLQDSVGDSLFVVIIGKPSSLDSAVTRDVNGNGYLDEIELYFNKSVTFPANYPMDSLIVVGNITFKVDSIGGLMQAGPSGLTGTHFVLYLHEDSLTRPGVPQTSWRPVITINGLPGAEGVADFRTTDGAGPVIWTVTKTIGNTEDRTQDRVTVTFSEKIFDKDGVTFKLTNLPGLVFTVWKRNSSGGFDSVPGVLDSIMRFATLLNDSTLQFDMLNGKDLTSNEYLSISIDSQVTDQAHKNYPDDNNRKVPVYIQPVPPDKIVPVPNPSKPTFVHSGQGYGPGQLVFKNEPNARDWVRREGAGTVLTFQINPPSDSTQTVHGSIKIFDVVGNLVNQANTDDVISSLNIDRSNLKSQYTYDIYWNGSNAKGTKVAAGIYGTIAYITYETPGKPNQTSRLLGTIGVTE